MQIIGFSTSTVSAERKPKISGKLDIKSNLEITDISEDKSNISPKPTLKFDFLYTVNYVPDAAKIKLAGSILVLDEADESKDILREWKKQKFSHAIKIPLFNFILNKCNIKSLQLEEELGLPPHLPFPQVSAEDKSQTNKKAEVTSRPANYTG